MNTMIKMIALALMASLCIIQAQNLDTAYLTSALKSYGEVLMWQQQQMMERVRMQGDSGIMRVRNAFLGTKPYYTNTWAREDGQAAIHDHSDYRLLVGMGDFSAVLNGVHFLTRHNDYKLNKPSNKTSKYGALEDIQFPPVPPSVLQKSSLPEQIKEMREYFRAFANQDTKIRDYRPYFKPVISYVQGMWTIPNDTVDEPFPSNRHRLGASTWEKLQVKVMHQIWSGRKDSTEGLASLPTMVYKIDSDGSPRVAQWNYKILCHPVSRDIPTKRFRLVPDIGLMLRSGLNETELSKTRNARFQLHPSITEPKSGWKTEFGIGWENFLEELMYEVPGLDNYPANISDSSFGDPPLRRPNGAKLNAGYFHRYYSFTGRDASGLSKTSRGYADANLFMALNKQPKIAPIVDIECEGTKCITEEVRASYAFPLEIIYLTPLHAWNPYNITFHKNSTIPKTNSETSAKRTGERNDVQLAFNGSAENAYYLTPAEFFDDEEASNGTADSGSKGVYVLDQSGDVKHTVASGVRIFLPHIPGVGIIRTRYPIFNVHDEGSSIYKDVTALRDIVQYLQTKV